jgi:hypothetical protein
MQHPGIEKGKPLFLMGSLLLAATQCAQGNTPERFLFCFILYTRTLQSIGDKKFPQATGIQLESDKMYTYYAGNFVSFLYSVISRPFRDAGKERSSLP